MPDLSTEMRGPIAVRHTITEYLRSCLDGHVAALAGVLGLPVPEMIASAPGEPRTDGYFAREPGAIDRWPMLSVTSGRMVGRGAVDVDDDGSETFRSTYPIRVYTWVKAVGFDDAQDLRDVYGTAVRIAVLARPGLDTNGRVQANPSTLVTDFSSVKAVNGDRHVAGSYVGFDVTAIETLTDRLAYPLQQPRDTVSGVNATDSAPMAAG